MLFLRAVGSGSAFLLRYQQRFYSWKPLSLLRYQLENPQVAEQRAQGALRTPLIIICIIHVRDVTEVRSSRFLYFFWIFFFYSSLIDYYSFMHEWH